MFSHMIRQISRVVSIFRALEPNTLTGLLLTTLIRIARAVGVPLIGSDGFNRTLRPAGIVLLEGAYTDTIYWADAGAGAILGMRFDQTGLRVLRTHLSMPECLVLDSTDESYQRVKGYTLFWGDSEANRIQRCTIVDGTLGGAGDCSAVVDVVTGVSHIAGLALDPAASTLYWADGYDLRIRSVKFDPVSGAADMALSLTEVVSYVAMPAALFLEKGSGGSSDRLYFLDQAVPMSLSRVWLQGTNGTQLLVKYGLSRPRAVSVSRTQGFYLIADSGLRSMLLARTSEKAPVLRAIYKHPRQGAGSFEPRGMAMRSNVNMLIDLDGSVRREAVNGTESEEEGEVLGAESSAASSSIGRRRGAWNGIVAAGATALAGALALVLSQSHEQPGASHVIFTRGPRLARTLVT